jgi:hypothetical protein
MARSTATSSNGSARIEYEQDPDEEETHPGTANRVTMLGIVAGLSELRTEVLNLSRAVRRLALSMVVWAVAAVLVSVVLWWAR